MKTKGAHDMFIDLLVSYNMDEKFIQPFVSQLRKTFQSMKTQTFDAKKDYEKRVKELEHELETLDERYAYGKFDDEALYKRLRLKKKNEINQVMDKLEGTDYEISNLNYFIEKSI
jgi:site-specific DNA recombinase